MILLIRISSNIPTRTGKPGGNFIDTNSLSLSKCLKGAITSRTFSKLNKKKKTVDLNEPLISDDDPVSHPLSLHYNIVYQCRNRSVVSFEFIQHKKAIDMDMHNNPMYFRIFLFFIFFSTRTSIVHLNPHCRFQIVFDCLH